MSSKIARNIFSGKKALLFDFDGTIADTFKLHEQAFIQALAPYNVQFSYADYTGMSTGSAIRMIFESNRLDVGESVLEQAVQEKRNLANKYYKEQIRFVPGAYKFIEEAYKSGYKLYIGSSGSRMNISTGVEKLRIAEFFSGIITADDVTHSKPDPEIYQTILSRHNFSPEAALVIEDAVSGIRAAAAAGVDVVCVDMFVDTTEDFKVRVLKAGFDMLTQLLKDEQQHG